VIQKDVELVCRVLKRHRPSDTEGRRVWLAIIVDFADTLDKLTVQFDRANFIWRCGAEKDLR
jgi:hypothetical protein